MKEILGNNLRIFFDLMDKNCDSAERTYNGNDYEVWEVSDDLFMKMCKMACDIDNEQFAEIAGDEAWWRYSDGSNLKSAANIVEFNVNGKTMLGFESLNFTKAGSSYKNLTEYLCECVGASLPKNVCACAVDLAEFNNMTLGELFSVYQGRTGI